jgi:hypothetical protein
MRFKLVRTSNRLNESSHCKPVCKFKITITYFMFFLNFNCKVNQHKVNNVYRHVYCLEIFFSFTVTKPVVRRTCSYSDKLFSSFHDTSFIYFLNDVPFTVAVVLQITPSICYWCCGSINVGHCVGSHLRIKCALAQIWSIVHRSFKCCFSNTVLLMALEHMSYNFQTYFLTNLFGI